jgi:two-component system sensor histidine kinase/response regulator
MFRRYGRLSARPTGGEPSTGLGLSIVKKLVHNMNGELTCDSLPNQGATFIVRLHRSINPI